ncbi:hypothetical protein ACVW0Y_002358 [Pseudomonas sp. TE3786]
MNDKSNVTTSQPFDPIDGEPLFQVNAGVPIDEALARAANLMMYVETLAAADSLMNKDHERAILQTLSEMAKALTNACRGVAA